MKESGICPGCVDRLTQAGVIGSTDEGLRINYPGIKGFYRIRLDNPAPGKGKYTQPKDTGSRLFRAPLYKQWSTGSHPIFITEGEKKALALDCRFEGRFGVLGIGGVWNWTGGKDEGRRILIEDFHDIDLSGRSVYIVFDSDAEDNQQVLQAERGLARALQDKKAKVKIIALPPEHKGIDDWLVAWGDRWREELRELAREAMHTRSGDRYRAIYDQVYSFEDMVGTKFPMPEFYCGTDVFGLVGQGMVTIIHGPTNVGKTYLATQMAVSIATGNDWLDHPCRKAKVLVLQGELPPGLYARGRLMPWMERVGCPENLKFYNWSFNFAESSRFREAFEDGQWQGLNNFETMLDEHRPDVVLIDPLQSYHNLVEASNDQLRELLKRLKRIAISRNLALVCVDHDRKSGGDGTNALRGASAKSDLADAVIGLVKDEGAVMLKYSKVRYINRAIPDPFEIHMADSTFYVGPRPDIGGFTGE